MNDFPNDFVVEDVQGVGEGFEEFAESSVCGGQERGGNGGRLGIVGGGWVEGALVKICEVKPVDVGVEGELDGRHVLMCDHIG